jgi:hypothetical protein
MAIRNVTPGAQGARISIIGFIAGTVFLIVGGWLIYSDWQTLLKFLKLFAGFFLVLFGLGVVGASMRR